MRKLYVMLVFCVLINIDYRKKASHNYSVSYFISKPDH